MEFQRSGVSLGQLLDNMVQKTYHELTVLADLLPRKPDMERKVEIVKFASRTRQQLMRMLALVKWANSAQYLDKCQEITGFLDQQSMLFASTADQLHHLAKGTLVSARLPNFSLPVAVDVLATGTYSRLPTVIKDKIVPETLLSPDADLDTKKELEEIIRQRLVSADLPSELRGFSIAHGRVTFTAKEEFEVALTVVNSSFTMPWRLLSLKILVKDPKHPKGPLVAPQQVEMLHRLAQAQLFNPESPLELMHKCLHSFCVSLQLEVLHSQAFHLMADSLLPIMKITNYKPGVHLIIEYWKTPLPQQSATLSASQGTAGDKAASETCLLHISTENAEPDATGPLRLDVVHTPSLPTVDMESGDCRRWQPVALDIGHLCVESLAQHAIEIRIASRLHSLYKYLVQFPLYRDRVHFQADSLQLVISFNDGSSEGDALLIFVDSQAGSYRARLLPSDPFNVLNFLEIVQLLNKPFTLDLIKRLDRLRARVVLQHCRRQMESRGWSVYSRLPMSPVVTALSKLGPDYILIKLAKQQSAGYLVVEVVSSNTAVPDWLDIQCHLLHTWPSQYGGQATPSTSSASSNGSDQPDSFKSGFLNALLSPLDASTYIGSLRADKPHLVHGLRRKIPRLLEEDDDCTAALLRVGEVAFPPAPILPKADWVGLLADMTEMLIPFSTFLQHLSTHGFSHAHIRVDPEAGVTVHITRFPTPTTNVEAAAHLADRLISCQVISPLGKNSGYFVSFLFCDCPLRSILPNEQGSVRRLLLPLQQGASPANRLLMTWNAMAFLYGPVLELAAYLKDPLCETRRQCCVLSYTYMKISLAYGPGFRYLVNIVSNKVEFSMLTETYRNLVLAAIAPQDILPDCQEAVISGRNPHSFLADPLTHRFFLTKSLPLFVQGLHHTLPPLLALCHIRSVPSYSISLTSDAPPGKMFTLVGHSASSFCIIYRGLYQIEVEMKMDGVVSVRDCGYRPSSAADGAFPQRILHFKDFVLLFQAANSHKSKANAHVAGRKFANGVAESGLFTPVPLTPSGNMPAPSFGGAEAIHANVGSTDALAPNALSTTNSGGSVSEDLAAPMDVDAIMRDLHGGGSGIPSSGSPHTSGTFDSGLPSLDDVNVTTPGGIMDMFSPSFVEASPGNMATPSPATLKGITGIKPISVNSPSILPWAVGGTEADFPAAAAGVEPSMEPFDEGWGSIGPWSLSDVNSDAGMLMGDPLAVPPPPPSQSGSSVISPPTASTAMPSTAMAPPGQQPGVATPTGNDVPAQLLPQMSSFSSRLPSVSSVAEPTPVVSTMDERITPLGALADAIMQQKIPEVHSTWHMSMPALVTHHCWFELLRPRTVSCNESPSAAPGSTKPASQDSGLGSLHSEALLGNGGSPQSADDMSFVLSPMEGFLGSVYMLQHLRAIQNDPMLGQLKCISSGLSVTLFASHGLKCRIWLDPTWPYILQISVEAGGDSGSDTISAADCRALENLFRTKVARPPYRQNALVSFSRLFCLPRDNLLDLLQISHMSEESSDDFLWRPELCMLIPPSIRAPSLAAPGQSAIALGNKVLVMVRLTPTSSNTSCTEGDRVYRPVTLPFVYYPQTNVTEYIDFQSPNQPKGFVPTPSIDLTYNQRISQATAQTITKWKLEQKTLPTPSLASAVRYVCTHMSLRDSSRVDPLNFA